MLVTVGRKYSMWDVEDWKLRGIVMFWRIGSLPFEILWCCLCSDLEAQGNRLPVLPSAAEDDGEVGFQVVEQRANRLVLWWSSLYGG